VAGPGKRRKEELGEKEVGYSKKEKTINIAEKYIPTKNKPNQTKPPVKKEKKLYMWPH
jgi:hypothetical protein